MLAGFFAKLVGVPVIGAIVRPIANALLQGYKAKLQNQTSQEAIAADFKKRELDLDQREAELNAQTVRVEQGNWITRWVRPAFAVPFVAYTWKRVLWDKVVMGDWKHGVTDRLSGQMADVFMLIVIAYFGARGLQYVVREFKKTR